MNLYEQWENLSKIPSTPEQQKAFWDDYFKEETKVYKQILADNTGVYEGTAAELAGRFGLDEVLFPAFTEGINTSLREPVDFKALEPDTPVKLDIDFEKLFYNMNDAKAKWLYTLPEWDDVLSVKRRAELTREWRESCRAVSEKTVGRNELCPCGSGKKYKKCCMGK